MSLRIGLLFVLYFVQGLPFGLQGGFLPVYLREGGTSLTVITLAGLLALPWSLKLLWAPMVERTRAGRLGRRRAWIVPLQLGLAVTCAAAALAEPDHALAPLLGLVLLMNAITALMDIAVDGLAVDTLRREHLGYGNISQVVGYKLGMLASGGLGLVAIAHIGWAGLMGAMSCLALAGVAAALAFREPDAGASAPDAGARAESARAIARLAVRALLAPESRWLVAIVATYKIGEYMADALFKPFLVDAGFARDEIGLWVVTYGTVASLAGSFAGGILASRVTLIRALAITAVLRVAPIAATWWLTTTTPAADAVIAVTLAENALSGALTTVMFAYMMSQVDRRIGATHFTALATIEVWGKSLGSWVAGPLADATGYAPVMGLATILTIAFLGLLVPVSRAARDADTLGR